MRVINDISIWQKIRQQITPGQSIGLVPTMGNLHAGHQSLLAMARAQNDLVVLSIFVNPTQFDNSEDLQQYPRTLDADLILAQESGVDFVLIPTAEAMYPDNYYFNVNEQHLSQVMEGRHRPGHFNGMLTIVLKLLCLVRPTVTYFGEKDYQQLLLVQHMAKAFLLETHVAGCPIQRDSQGLALSSRNQRLSATEKKLAQRINGILKQASSCEVAREQLQQLGISVDYVEDHYNRRFVAAHIGKVRLIDNVTLELETC